RVRSRGRAGSRARSPEDAPPARRAQSGSRRRWRAAGRPRRRVPRQPCGRPDRPRLRGRGSGGAAPPGPRRARGRGRRARPAVAPTVDDGPGPYTAQLLAELRAGAAHATFFVVGNRLAYWPEEVRSERAFGTIGNHSFSHPHLAVLPRWLVWLELLRAQADVR